MKAGNNLSPDDGGAFRYPSYVQAVMGDIFSLGFGPYRWVCTSGDAADLATTDAIAADVLRGLAARARPASAGQYRDNLRWIEEASKHQLVVGSQARILYSDCEGRQALAKAFNDAVSSGRLRAPIVLSRDHHDVSGTDSPYRETANIEDGSEFTADMAVQNALGDAARGATWVALHNGGGVGWGEVINGGFGLVLDGSIDAGRRASAMLAWDVSNGLARRAWSGHPEAQAVVTDEMHRQPGLLVTMPVAADAAVIASALAKPPQDISESRHGAPAQPQGEDLVLPHLPSASHPRVELLLVNCRVATMSTSIGVPYGMIEDAAIVVGADGLLAAVCERAHLPKGIETYASRVTDLEGALVTPGLIDCHTHIVYGAEEVRFPTLPPHTTRPRNILSDTSCPMRVGR
jgi:hypothetical protein